MEYAILYCISKTTFTAAGDIQYSNTFHWRLSLWLIVCSFTVSHLMHRYKFSSLYMHLASSPLLTSFTLHHRSIDLLVYFHQFLHITQLLNRTSLPQLRIVRLSSCQSWLTRRSNCHVGHLPYYSPHLSISIITLQARPQPKFPLSDSVASFRTSSTGSCSFSWLLT
jgi:hypothetical protein